jgi:hypothetical protein
VNGTAELGARTKIELTPGQLIAVMAMVLMAAAWCWRTDTAVVRLGDDVKALQGQIGDLRAQIDEYAPPLHHRTR